MEEIISEYVELFPGYKKSLEELYEKPKPFYHTNFDKSLEKIVQKEEPELKNVGLEGVFLDRDKTVKSTIKAVLNDILTREKLNSVLLYAINDNICGQHSYLEELKNLNRFNYSPELFNNLHSKRMNVEAKVLDLEQEKRKEYLECWNDLVSLRKELLSTLKDYWKLGNSQTYSDMENGNSRGYMSEAEAYNWQ